MKQWTSYLAPLGLGVLYKTTPRSLDSEKYSLYTVEYLAKDMEGGGSRPFLAGFLPVPSGGTALGEQSEENAPWGAPAKRSPPGAPRQLQKGAGLLLSRVGRCQKWGSKSSTEFGASQS